MAYMRDTSSSIIIVFGAVLLLLLLLHTRYSLYPSAIIVYDQPRLFVFF